MQRRWGAVSKTAQTRVKCSVKRSGKRSTPSRAGSCSSPLRLARPARPAGRRCWRAKWRATCTRSACGAAAPLRSWRTTASRARSSTSATSGWTKALSAPPSIDRNRACQYRRPLGALGRPAGQARPQGDAPASVRWFHIDGEHTGTAVYRELEFANQIVNPQGIVVIDDFFSPRYPANTTEVIRYMEKNPFHFRLLAVGFNKGYLCRPPRRCRATWTSWPRACRPPWARYGAKTTIFKTTGPWDTDAVGITEYVPDGRPDRRYRQRAAALAHDTHEACCLGTDASPAERLAHAQAGAGQMRAGTLSGWLLPAAVSKSETHGRSLLGFPRAQCARHQSRAAIASCEPRPRPPGQARARGWRRDRPAHAVLPRARLHRDSDRRAARERGRDRAPPLPA